MYMYFTHPSISMIKRFGHSSTDVSDTEMNQNILFYFETSLIHFPDIFPSVSLDLLDMNIIWRCGFEPLFQHYCYEEDIRFICIVCSFESVGRNGSRTHCVTCSAVILHADWSIGVRLFTILDSILNDRIQYYHLNHHFNWHYHMAISLTLEITCLASKVILEFYDMYFLPWKSRWLIRYALFESAVRSDIHPQSSRLK